MLQHAGISGTAEMSLPFDQGSAHAVPGSGNGSTRTCNPATDYQQFT
jgi:hypothetical protein